MNLWFMENKDGVLSMVITVLVSVVTALVTSLLIHTSK